MPGPPKSPDNFPFLKLPHFPLKYVINQMDFVDVIILTMKYKRFKRAVESAKLYVDQLHFHLGLRHKHVSVTHQRREFEIETIYNVDGFELTGMKLNGVATPICYCLPTEMKVYAESDEAKMDVLDKITQHLLSIFFVRKFTAQFLVKCNFENLFIWKYTKKFGKLNIEPLVNTELVVSPKELRFLLEDLKIDEPVLDLKVENGYKYSNYPLQGSIIDIPNFNFIDLDKLTIGPDCVFLTFDKTYRTLIIPTTCGNRLLKEWIAGKNEKLEEMRFQLKDFFKDHNSNVGLFEGITTTMSTFSKKQLEKRDVWIYDPLNFPPLEIKRSTDGRLGTISRCKTCVILYVWHPKHYIDIVDEMEEDSE